MLISLDMSKSSGSDGISPRMLKSTAYSIALSLTKLFNLSLTTGVFPSDWKLSRVVPVPKGKKLRTSVAGYCPISILPTVSKIVESHVNQIILSSTSETYPISNHQWGFMHHRTSTSALISVIHDWLTALEDGNEICVIFFDIQKAFDSVPHVALLLADIGIDLYLLRWIQNYLKNGMQYVVVEGASSPTLQVLSGVPQGSVLGPLLFILHLNDVIHCISEGSEANIYADDIALYRTIRSPEDYVYLQADIDSVAACLDAKLLTLNVSKYFYHAEDFTQSLHQV